MSITSARSLPAACLVTVAMVAGAAPLAATAAVVPDYAPPALQLRSNIVDGFNLPAGSSFNSGTPALADGGAVGMRLLTVGGTAAPGIWRGPGDGSGMVVSNVSPDLFPGDVAFDAAGALVYELFDVFSDGIYRLPVAAGAPTLLVAPGGPFNLDFFSDPRPVPGGDLVFRGGNFSGDRWIRWSSADGSQTSYVAETDPGIGFVFTPDADDAGRMIGKVRLGSTSGDSPDEIRRYDAPGSFTALARDADALPGSPFASFDNSVTATPGGAAVFVAGLVGGGRGVYLAGDDGITTIATTADPLVSDISFFRPVGNDAGTVAFRGTDAAGLDAVFVGDGRTLVRLIGEHDLIETDLGTARIDQNDGSVTFGGSPAINAAGSVAFAATLTPPGNNQIEWGTGVFVAVAAPAGEPADVDGDGDVDFEDLLAVLAAYGTADPDADVDGSGTVDFEDLLAVLAAYRG